MISTGIYLMLMISLLIICIIKKYNIISWFLVGYYLFIAIVSYIAGMNGLVEVSRTSLFIYLFLFFSYILYFYPFLKKNEKLSFDKVDYSLIEKFRPFCYVYILCAGIAIYSYYSPLKALIQSGDWAMTRYMHYLEGNVTVYTNLVEQIGIAFTLYFFLLAVLIGMLMLKNKSDSRLAYILLASAIISNLMQALYVVGRGTIFNDIILIFAMYLFMIRGIDKKKVIFISLLLFVLMIVIVPLMVAITESRFSSSANSELLRYFGEAPVVFNVDVARINKYSLGKYLFSGLFNTGFSQTAIGGTWGVRFYTFVGFIFIDWGPIGVLLLGAFWGLRFFNKIVNKSSYRISDLFIIFYYYQFLLKGGLVIGTAFLIDIIYALITYLFIRNVIEKIKFKHRKIRFGKKKYFGAQGLK